MIRNEYSVNTLFFFFFMAQAFPTSPAQEPLALGPGYPESEGQEVLWGTHNSPTLCAPNFALGGIWSQDLGMVTACLDHSAKTQVGLSQHPSNSNPKEVKFSSTSPRYILLCMVPILLDISQETHLISFTMTSLLIFCWRLFNYEFQCIQFHENSQVNWWLI